MAQRVLAPGDVHPEDRADARMCAGKPARRSSVAQGRLPGAARMRRMSRGALTCPERLS